VVCVHPENEKRYQDVAEKLKKVSPTKAQLKSGVHIFIEWKLAVALRYCLQSTGVAGVLPARERDRVYTIEAMNLGIELASYIVVVCGRDETFVL
jgi:hypothetical protein